MNDPYRVLGVDSNCSDEQLRAAYRELAVKYATDDYAESPLSDIAAQKSAEIDAAFDAIMSQRRLKSGDKHNEAESYHTYAAPDNSGGAQSTGGGTHDDGRYLDIREYLRRGDVRTAEQRLLAIDTAQRGAEWSFLMGGVCRAKGWLDEAARYYDAAAAAEPSNSEYRVASDQFNRQRATGQSGYRPFSQQSAGAGSDCSDGCGTLCQCLICLQLCDCCCHGH